eukprot:COSAG01_NODE_6773_length_3505_cov_1.753376_1_plen_95_part_00
MALQLGAIGNFLHVSIRSQTLKPCMLRSSSICESKQAMRNANAEPTAAEAAASGWCLPHQATGTAALLLPPGQWWRCHSWALEQIGWADGGRGR